MKCSYRLNRLCGNVFNNGNLIFTADGNSIISPVGNRVTLFDLVEQSSTTLPFENRKNIRRCVLSHDGRFLITVDTDGHALFINFPRRIVLQRFHFKRKVYDIKFAPNDEAFAVTYGNGIQIWKTPSVQREFSPLTLSRVIGGHSDETVCLDWSDDSQSLICGSKDLTARVFYRVHSKHMAMTVLSGHRDHLVGVFFTKDGEGAYTVAQDGAVFTWEFQYGERIPVVSGNKKRKHGMHDNEDDASDGDDSEDEDEDEDNENAEGRLGMRSKRGGKWVLAEREFLWDPHTVVASVAFNKNAGLLVIGFDNGVFGLYEMPGCVNIHRLSVSHHSLNTVSINASGEWLGIGSAKLGQLLIWEWKSETYVLKQQGHLYGLNDVDFSSDGQFIATAGEDSKVKLWNAASGFCTVTFSEHVAPVSAVRFVGKGAGKAVLSASLDGTVRAHDLLRYRNFRTLTTATPVQFTSLAADPSGEVVCAGSLDPFNIYVWALQTGRLLDVLAGHEGPIACLEFSSSGGMLASGSWDGTCKLWNVYKNECIETFEHGCDVLGIAFRPDSKEICTATTNGLLSVWDVEGGTLVRTIEGRHDISGGRLSTDAVTAQNASRSKHFTTITYTADGACILAGGHSKYTCLYNISSGTLVKKYQLSHNRSLDGVLDELRSDQLVDGISMDNLNAELGGDSDEERLGSAGLPGSSGKSRGGAGGMGAGDGARTTRPQILTAAVRFSPTGREWAAATTQGLQVFSLDDAMLFAPTELDASVTPQAVMRAIESKQFGKALTMALQLSLSETRELKAAVDAVPMAAIELVVKSLDPRMLKELLRFLAEELTLSRHIEFYLRWCWELLRSFGPTLQADAGRSMAHKQTLRALIRSISMHERESIRMADENGFYLQFLCSQLIPGEGEDNSAVELVKYTEDRVAQEVSINTVAKGEASSETTKRARQTKSRKVGVLSN